MSEGIDIFLGNFDSSLSFIQSGNSHAILCIDVRLAEWQFTALTYSFPNLEPGKSGIPFSWWVFQFVVIHTKALAYSLKQKEIFFWNSLIFLWSSRCWQFDLWFLRLFKSNLYIWKFSFHILLKPMLKDFEHYFASMWNGWDCEVVWTLFGIVLLWDWNENWSFPALWPQLSFPNLLDIECSTLTSSFRISFSTHTLLGFGIIQLEFHHLH